MELSKRTAARASDPVPYSCFCQHRQDFSPSTHYFENLSKQSWNSVPNVVIFYSCPIFFNHLWCWLTLRNNNNNKKAGKNSIKVIHFPSPSICQQWQEANRAAPHPALGQVSTALCCRVSMTRNQNICKCQVCLAQTAEVKGALCSGTLLFCINRIWRCSLQLDDSQLRKTQFHFKSLCNSPGKAFQMLFSLLQGNYVLCGGWVYIHRVLFPASKHWSDAACRMENQSWRQLSMGEKVRPVLVAPLSAPNSAGNELQPY